MEQVNEILKHPAFRKALEELEELERDRPFCRHGLEHLLAVARLAYLYDLEEGAGIPARLIYAAALLHDIARGEQYRNGTPHDLASVKLAEPILIECGFCEAERREILGAISAHRSGGHGGNRLAELICRADKRSRPCYACQARALCNWPEEKQNLRLER